MDFYLARHGEAVTEAENPQRPLSARGREAVERVARAMAGRGIRVSEIVHSGKLRAKQTAEILGQSLAPEKGVREMKGLSPDDDPLEWKIELEERAESLVVVGHLPHLARLASLLVFEDPDRDLVELAPAAVLCLSRADAQWKLRWSLTPDSA